MSRLRELLSWVTAHATRVVVFLGALAALIVTIITLLCTITPICGDDLHSEIKTVSPTQVMPGQEFDVTGKHLDLVEEVRLRRKLKVERLFMMPLGETGMLLAVPSGVEPQEYMLETREKGKQEFVSTDRKLHVITPTPTPTPPPKPTPIPTPPPPTIVFANLNWDSARMQNAIARFIIEKGYNYRMGSIPDVPGMSDDVWKLLLTGSVQVYMEIWLPQSQKQWEQALESGSVIPLGKSLDLNWQSGFVVPTYMVRANPGSGPPPAPDLRTVQDLRKYAHLFRKQGSGNRAVLWNCLAVWRCAETNQKQVEAYGLDDVIQLRDPGTDEELFNKLYLAYENKLPWLGYMWGPTKASTDLDLERLEEPTCKAGQAPEDGCGYALARVRIAVHPSLIAAAPDVVELLRKWDFKESTLFVAEECLEENGEDFDKAAVCYLKREQAVWAQWMPTEVTLKVREALRKE